MLVVGATASGLAAIHQLGAVLRNRKTGPSPQHVAAERPLQRHAVVGSAASDGCADSGFRIESRSREAAPHTSNESAMLKLGHTSQRSRGGHCRTHRRKSRTAKTRPDRCSSLPTASSCRRCGGRVDQSKPCSPIRSYKLPSTPPSTQASTIVKARSLAPPHTNSQ